ncbi:MAG TPA: lysophospholipid acyltransferase family protein [Candidatus Binatia bacterium]|jgi:1-acyl-sn-glycerol-3-phosphate acyltransferase
MTTAIPLRLRRLARFVSRILLTWMRALATAAEPRVTAALAVDCAQRTLASLAVDVTIHGESQLRDGPLLVVANHVSWLDVYVLNALTAARFVAKSEVRKWPIVGPIAAAFGTFFIVRGSFRDAARVKDAIGRALRAGERVVVFPEGTTTDGTRVSRFYAALLQAAVDAGVPVQAVAIRYVGPDGMPDPAAAFIDDMTFAESLRRVLGRERIAAEVRIAPVFPSRQRTRRELAFATRRWITAALGFEDPRHEAEAPADPSRRPQRPRRSRRAA